MESARPSYRVLGAVVLLALSEPSDVLGAVLHHELGAELQVVLGQVHIIIQGGESEHTHRHGTTTGVR